MIENKRKHLQYERYADCSAPRARKAERLNSAQLLNRGSRSYRALAESGSTKTCSPGEKK